MDVSLRGATSASGCQYKDVGKGRAYSNDKDWDDIHTYSSWNAISSPHRTRGKNQTL